MAFAVDCLGQGNKSNCCHMSRRGLVRNGGQVPKAPRSLKEILDGSCSGTPRATVGGCTLEAPASPPASLRCVEEGTGPVSACPG